MARFAKIENNVVINVIIADPEFINTQEGTYIESNSAGIGYTLINNELVAPRPFPSWTLDQNNEWQPPVEKPAGHYIWNEQDLSWEAFNYGSKSSLD